MEQVREACKRIDPEYGPTRCGADDTTGHANRAKRSMSESDTTEGSAPKAGMARIFTLSLIAVLVAGGLIGGGLAWSLHRYGGGSSCPSSNKPEAEALTTPTTFLTKGPLESGPSWVIVGDTAGLSTQAEPSPYYLTLGGRCEYWLVLEHNVLYAYKARIANSSCAIIWNDPKHAFICQTTKAVVPKALLQRWPARTITSGPSKGSFEIEFN
jgi:hypothetical protein